MDQLRVWHLRNVPSFATHYEVATPELAAWLIEELAEKDLQDPLVYNNAFGLEMLEGDEWTEWFTDTGDDIHEYSEWLADNDLMFAYPND